MVLCWGREGAGTGKTQRKAQANCARLQQHFWKELCNQRLLVLARVNAEVIKHWSGLC